jgi:F1F0 ATPase subunit 2
MIDPGEIKIVVYQAIASIDFAGVFVSLVSGTALGLLYFGGLWLTVKRLPKSSQPGLLTVTSFFVRTGIVILGFYYVMEGRMERLLAALVGFLIIRIFLVRLIGPLQAKLRKT